MGWQWCAVALCALAIGAGAYTVDCNHEYTDCETELSKLGSDDDEPVPASTSIPEPVVITTTSPPPTIPPPPRELTTPKPPETTTKIQEPPEITEAIETTETPKQPRLLNLNVDELQNFANALHNETDKQNKQKIDLSDVNMDDEDEEPPRLISHDHNKHDKTMPDKFYTNLQEPFHGLLSIDRASEEIDTCKENEISYKIGDTIERGCEETCECSPGGTFDCTPRCKHPYIRRGRRLNDPLCFESPVDECCSIIACASGNQDLKVSKVEVCRYNNDTHTVGERWHIGCDQTCSCEANSVVTCKPRCKKLEPSDKCINVQDPNDECCEVQVCDVSQDAHEEPLEANTTSTSTSTTTESIKGFEDYSDIVHSAPETPNQIHSTPPSPTTTKPVAEPIGSVKVLQNNSVQVNLQHVNTSEDPIHLLLSSDGGKNFEDVELKYSNLIIDLPRGKDYILKTKETGTKFNFTMTTIKDEMVADNGSVSIKKRIGCNHAGQFYEVGEEFHIGCTELCECTGEETKQCVELVCPNHVGLELVSKGCVKWAPNPPAQPPNCCPRSARCLSDGTCHYKGVAVPNWSEVSISLTGCSQRCFCENGELECQEVCAPLPPLPPATLRCPPLHRPAPLNISDDDCCKQWGCVPNAEEMNATIFFKYDVAPALKSENIIKTIIPPPIPTTPFPNIPILPTITTQPTDFYRHLHPVKSYPKMARIGVPSIIDESQRYSIEPQSYPLINKEENYTVVALDAGSINKHMPTAKVVTSLSRYILQPPPNNQKFRPPNQNIHELLKVPQERLTTMKPTSFFLPAYNPSHKSNNDQLQIIPLNYFVPAAQNKSENFVLSKPASMIPNRPRVYKTSLTKLKAYTKQVIRDRDSSGNPFTGQSSHVLYQAPNPYETVLLRPVPYIRHNPPRYENSLGIDQLMNQFDIKTGGNRNLGRSADKIDEDESGQADMKPSGPAGFIPTIPPEIHFPTDDLPDYDQNNIHRPINTRDPILTGLPPGLTIPPNYGDENKKLTVLSIQADSPTSVKLLFGLPPVLVGLRGSVDLRYTDQPDEDISHWYSQVFAPADEVLTTPRLEFRLTGLKPSTIYRIKGKLFLHNLPVEPQSQVYTVRTLDLPAVIPLEEKRKEIDCRLMLIDVNDTAAHVSWRHFTEEELQFIDGIQVRYRPVGTPIYSMTELLHHSRSIAELHDLRPNTKYEASLILVPPPRATTELHDPGRVEFTTAPFVDPYNWTVTIEAHVVGSDAAELTWRGVPSPAERWVRVYRAAHACGASRHEHDAFRLATRDLPPTIVLSGLDSSARCRVWMELFLTNGKIKTSNVLEIVTKSQDSPEEIDNEIEASSIAGGRGEGRGDYYGALVVVGVVAALGAMTSLLLLLVLVRRHRPRSVPITPVPTAPRDSSLPPYDNPAYKLELQQETMGKLGSDDDEPVPASTSIPEPVVLTTTSPPPTIPPPPRELTTPKPPETTTKIQEPPEITEAIETTETPKQPRLLNLNVDELQNFANALHNETDKQNKQKIDLSDVNMDDEDEEPPRLISHDHNKHDKTMPDKFYTNLQEPFHGLLSIDRASEEIDTCKENEISYKIGDTIERGCEETCECSPGGTFDCTPRCKHPYIRRGRRLNDPLCFESPVDECCSIIACASGNQDLKVSKVEVCRYNNDTHTVGERWHIGCDQTCSCEANSVVTCKPRCKKLEPSDKCINVQDPNDECCEVQVCDVSQDAHEEPLEANTTSTSTSTTTESIKGFEDYSDIVHNAPETPNQIHSTPPSPTTTKPVAEPIGSVKVLQNNSVQVNLQHVNTSEDPIHLLLSSDGGKNFEDVELKYSNLIIDLPRGKDYILKTKETGTKFNFTMTTIKDEMVADNGSVSIKERIGCNHDGQFYEVGEEFHIGCTELCECTGEETKQCVELVCPNHVGLELVSKGCVKWAPNPPAQPPNCCPRSARCLSDGTCHYKGVAVPNWSEVSISLTGCSQRCFCENGELECQEVCAPLPPLPPATLRCPPLHRPAPLNISDDDCCKQWGCVPNAEEMNATIFFKYDVAPALKSENIIKTIIPPPIPTTPFPNIPILPTITTQPTDFYRHLHPVKSYPKMARIGVPSIIDESQRYSIEPQSYPLINKEENYTVLALDAGFTNKHMPTAKVVTSPSRYILQPPSNIQKFRPPNQNIHELLKVPQERLTTIKPTSFFLPAYNPSHKSNNDQLQIIPLNYFVPAAQNKSENFVLSKPPSMIPNRPRVYKTSLTKLKAYTKQVIRDRDSSGNPFTGQSSHVLYQAPNPYETVLLRPVPYIRHNPTRYENSLGIDQLMNQFDIKTGGNRNLGRSADKIDEDESGQADMKPSGPAGFIPTIPPEIHFPTDDLPDYDQNNIHRPINTRDPILTGLPPGLTIPPNYGDENKKLTVLSIQADSPTSVKLLFGLPPVLVGLRGSVDLRYTDQPDEDISHWYSQVFAPADEVLTTPRLEFRLTGLKPSTIYRIKGKLFLHNLPVEPQSQVYTVRTLDLPAVIPLEEKRKEIDCRLMLIDVNDTAAHVSWRHFTEEELQFIDGIQVRYRPVGTPIYSMTELLHHSRSIAELHDLRPNTKYEASLILVPPPRATTELHDPGRVEFTTAPFVDPYNWTVTIEAHVVGSDAAELTWRGVPSPAERWVRVYRAAHACGASRHEHDAFRLATRDLPPTIVLSGLDSSARCRVWMELFLTNGKIKTSNVLEIVTKSQDSPEEIDNEIEASSIAGGRGEGRGDYYGALVVVGVVAALGAMTSLLLLLVLVRRHRPRSVPITPVPTAPRDSSLPPYDNPAYKLELQQETMDL